MWGGGGGEGGLISPLCEPLSPNCDEALFGAQKASLNMCWEYSHSSESLASGWLRAESSPVNKEEREEKWMTVSILHSLRKGTDLFVNLGKAQPFLWDPSS